MNNYKIIENRPELTTSQIVAGMNFAAVSTGAIAMSAGALGGKAVGAGLLTKGFLAVLAVAGGLAVYKNYDSQKEDPYAYSQARENDNIIQRDKSKGPLLIMETIPPKNVGSASVELIPPNAACQSSDEKNSNTNPNTTYNGPYVPLINIDSLNALEAAPVTSTKTPVAKAEMITCKKNDPEAKVEMPVDVEAKRLNDDFKQSPNAECRIWKPASFCIAPDEKATDIGMDCLGKGCEFDFINCTSLDNKGYSAVRLKITARKSGKFRVASNLKNIVLVKSTETQCVSSNPVAASFSARYDNSKGQSWNYQGNKLKADILNVRFTDYIDIYLVFKEEVKAGDKIIIEDFVMAKVVE